MSLTLFPKSNNPYDLLAPEIKKKFYDNESITVADIPNTDGIIYHHPGTPGKINSHLSVLGIANDFTACGYFRTAYPLMVLAQQGSKVVARGVTDKVGLKVEDFFGFNVYYLSRAITSGAYALVMKMSKLTGATVVYDLDDYLHGVDPSSPAYSVYNYKSNVGIDVLNSVNNFLKDADGVTFSTRELKGIYSSMAPEAHIFLNGLDCELGHRDWDDTKPKLDWRIHAERQGIATDSDSVNMFYSGGSTHLVDLQPLGLAIKEVLDKTKNSFFCIQTHPSLACRVTYQEWKLPMDRVVFIPTTQFKDYPKSLSMADVSITPIANTLFNSSKSNLRILETSAWGAPYVASKVAPYWRLHLESEGKGGYIAEYQQEFSKHLIKLLTDKDDRLEKGKFMRDFVRDKYDIRKTYASLGYSLTSMINDKQFGIKLPGFTEIQDEVNGIPKMSRKVNGKDICMCGCGRQYRKCLNNSFPAFGKV